MPLSDSSHISSSCHGCGSEKIFDPQRLRAGKTILTEDGWRLGSAASIHPPPSFAHLCEEWFVDLHASVGALAQHLVAPPPGVTDRWVAISSTAQEHSPLKVELLLHLANALMDPDDWIIQVWGGGMADRSTWREEGAGLNTCQSDRLRRLLHLKTSNRGSVPMMHHCCSACRDLQQGPEGSTQL